MTPPGPAPLPRCATAVSLALFVATLAMTGSARGDTAGMTDAPAPPVETRRFDPVRSNAQFEVKVLWLIGVHGHFGKVDGSVTIDRTAQTAAAEARLDVERITMRTRSYEDWAKSDEFFDARAFPLIHFTSKPFPLDVLRRGGEIRGTLRVRGIDRSVALSVRPSACPDAIARDCPVEARGSIERSDFGMNSRRGTVSDRVELGFSIYLAAAEAPVEK